MFPDADLVVLASPSAARAFAALARRVPVVSIGPQTTAAATASRPPCSSPRPTDPTSTVLLHAVDEAARGSNVAAVLITFLTDFGLDDDFVGVCHGVIERIAPGLA